MSSVFGDKVFESYDFIRVVMVEVWSSVKNERLGALIQDWQTHIEHLQVRHAVNRSPFELNDVVRLSS